jgi:hypothetical protein
MTALGTPLITRPTVMLVATSEENMQMQGTRRILHVVLVVVAYWKLSKFMLTMDLARMLMTGMTLMESTMTAPGTAATGYLIVPTMEVNMQTQGTQRIVHAVLVVAVVLAALLTEFTHSRLMSMVVISTSATVDVSDWYDEYGPDYDWGIVIVVHTEINYGCNLWTIYQYPSSLTLVASSLIKAII